MCSYSCLVAVKKSIRLLRKGTYISVPVITDAAIRNEPMKGCRLLDADAVFVSGGLAPKAPSPVGSGFPKLNPGGGDCVL